VSLRDQNYLYISVPPPGGKDEPGVNININPLRLGASAIFLAIIVHSLRDRTTLNNNYIHRKLHNSYTPPTFPRPSPCG
jgi:hypothetical protein